MTLRTRLERLEARNPCGLSIAELDHQAEQMRSEGRRVVVCPDNPPGRQLIEIVREPCRGAVVIRRSYGIRA